MFLWQIKKILNWFFLKKDNSSRKTGDESISEPGSSQGQWQEWIPILSMSWSEVRRPEWHQENSLRRSKILLIKQRLWVLECADNKSVPEKALVLRLVLQCFILQINCYCKLIFLPVLLFTAGRWQQMTEDFQSILCSVPLSVESSFLKTKWCWFHASKMYDPCKRQGFVLILYS